MIRKVVSILVLVAQLGFARAQSSMYDEIIDRNFKPHEPGGTVLIAKAGRIIFERAFGMASLELGVAMQQDMVFQIGSMTKQFTAVCILQLMEQHKLNLQDPIGKHIGGLPETWSMITLEHLLTHTSGIPELTIDQSTSSNDISLQAASKPMLFAAGTKRVYCNTGFALLGHVIERVTGMSYANYLQKEIILPLGMTKTFYNSNDKVYPGYVPAYVKKRAFINFKGTIAPSGAGALLSNTSDLLKWYTALTEGKLLKKETLQQAWTSHELANGQRLHNGYGWNTGGKIQGSPFVEHGGISGGHLAHAIYMPKEEICIVMFTNQRGLPPEVVSLELAAVALGKHDTVTAVKLSDSALQDYKGVYVEAGTGQKFITVSENSLYYQRGDGGPKLKMIAYGKDSFFFENTTMLARAERDKSGKVSDIVLFDKKYSDEPGSVLNRTDLPLPKAVGN